MISEIHTFPQFSQFTITMVLGPTKLTLRMTYRERTLSWYLDIYELNGTPLLLGRRLSANWIPMYGYAYLLGLIEGVLVVRGLEGYEQKDLGKTLILEYIPEQDLLLLIDNPTSPQDPIVTITSP